MPVDMKNQKIYWIAITIIMHSGWMQAQPLTPEFVLPLYLTDALGNSDTLWFGYDDRADNKNHPNANFGEYLIPVPYKAPIDARIFDEDDPAWLTPLKTLVTKSEDGLICKIPTGAYIFVYVENPPLTISYDSSLLERERCYYRDLVMSPSKLLGVTQYLWEVTPLYCLERSSKIVDDFSIQQGNLLYYQDSVPVEGLGLKNAYGYKLDFYLSRYCEGVPTNRYSSLLEIKIYPNPVSDRFELNITDGYDRIEIYDIKGRSVLTQYIEGQVEVSELPSGIYVIRAWKADQLVGIGKVAVID